MDVYALSHCVSVNTADMFEMFRKNPDRELGVFDEFYNSQQDVEHAYEQLRGVENKPPFAHVYSYLKKFLQPFAARDTTPRIWNSDKMTWEHACLERKPSAINPLIEQQAKAIRNQQR